MKRKIKEKTDLILLPRRTDEAVNNGFGTGRMPVHVFIFAGFSPHPKKKIPLP
ncbi:hypothetical protein ACOHYD_11470 [Desulfobacterota bacterium M19]